MGFSIEHPQILFYLPIKLQKSSEAGEPGFCDLILKPVTNQRGTFRRTGIISTSDAICEVAYFAARNKGTYLPDSTRTNAWITDTQLPSFDVVSLVVVGRLLTLLQRTYHVWLA